MSLLRTLGLLVLLAACSAENDAGLQKGFPDQHSKGFAVFASQCQQCHGLPQPSVHTAKAWPTIVAMMLKRRSQRGFVLPTVEQERLLLAYLQQHAAKGD